MNACTSAFYYVNGPEIYTCTISYQNSAYSKLILILYTTSSYIYFYRYIEGYRYCEGYIYPWFYPNKFFGILFLLH